MLIGRGRIKKIHNGISSFALVEIEIEQSDLVSTIEEKCCGEGWVEQGYIEEVSATGYNSWKEGAKLGIQFALKATLNENLKITITKIAGLTTDTNPSIIAAAAAYAVWDAMKIMPSENIVEMLQQVVKESWEHEITYIPARIC